MAGGRGKPLDAGPPRGRRVQRVLPGERSFCECWLPKAPRRPLKFPFPWTPEKGRWRKASATGSAILAQTKAALEKLRENNPDKIVTLGGECSVSVVPFTYLAGKYPDDVAVVWIDAHPDINLPGDEYKGYHAMALTACMGMGDEEIMKLLPGKVDASKVLIAGLRAWEKDGGTKERQKNLNIKSLSPAELAGSSDAVRTGWKRGAFPGFSFTLTWTFWTRRKSSRG